MNVFTAVVRLGSDPEQRFTPGGDSIVTFNAAVDSGYGDKKVTTWIRYNVWGKRGEAVLPYLAKGNQVAVSGELTNRKYEKDGQDRYSLEVRVNELTLLGGKQDKPQSSDQAPQRNSQGSTRSNDLSDDIPFAKRKDY